MKWTVLCDGGPNDKVVGKTLDSKRQAVSVADMMLRELSPERVLITCGDQFQTALNEHHAGDGDRLEILEPEGAT